MSYPVWTPGSWIFDKNFPIAVDGVPVAQPNFTDSPTVSWTLDPLTMQVTANFNGANPNAPTFVFTGTVNPTITAGLLTGSLYINTTTGAVFELQVVVSSNTWVLIGSIQSPVQTVFGRNGAVVAQFGDYSFSQISGSAAPTQLPTLDQINGVITSTQLPFPIVAGNINNVLSVDGVRYLNIQEALADLPAAGGTIDMRGNSSAAALSLGTFDPGTKAVTILLGPFTYTVNQITLRRALQIIGSGMYAANSTTLQATGGNSTPPFIIDQGMNAAQGVLLQGFNLTGTVANTSQMAINLSTPAGGLWYSNFNDMLITGFGGIGINFDAQASATAHQFCTFRNVTVLRPLNGNYALQLLGFCNSLKFENCEFDGQLDTQDGKTNINIAQGTQTITPPYNIKFDLVTCQFAGTGFLIMGADCVSIDQGHFENVEQCFTIGTGSGFGSLNITIHDTGFFNNCGKGTVSPGVGTSNGYICKITGATGNVSMAMIDSHVDTQTSAADAIFAGNTGSIVSFGNVIGYEGAYAYQPVQLGSPVGFGNGSSGTAVTTTALGTGSGPANPDIIVSYQQVTESGTVYWLPLFQ